MDEYKQYKQAYTGTTPASSGAPGVPPHAPQGEYSESGVLTNSLLTNSYTAVLGIRVPIRYHFIYRKMGEEERNVVREALKHLFIYMVSNAGARAGAATPHSMSAVYSFNVNVSVARAEAISGLDEFTKERVRLLQQKVRTAEEVLREYRRKTEEVRRLLAALQQALQARDWATAARLANKLSEVVG